MANFFPPYRKMLKSKIHRATVTDADLDYEGSITIDTALLKQADMLPYEAVCIYNITNGERFQTYAIEGPEGQGDICLNGAAAHKAKKGDLIIIASYSLVEDKKARKHQPTVILVDEQNRPKSSPLKAVS